MPSISSNKLVESLRVSKSQRPRGSLEIGNLGRMRSNSLPLKRHRRRLSLQIIAPIHKHFSSGLCSTPINLNITSGSHSTTALSATGTTPTAIGTTTAVVATIAATKTITPTEPIEKKDTIFTAAAANSFDLDHELENEDTSFKREKKSHKSLMMIRRFSKGVRSFFDNYTWILG